MIIAFRTDINIFGKSMYRSGTDPGRDRMCMKPMSWMAFESSVSFVLFVANTGVCENKPRNRIYVSMSIEITLVTPFAGRRVTVREAMIISRDAEKHCQMGSHYVAF